MITDPEKRAEYEARGCDNCAKRGPWQTEHGTGNNKAMTYELAECHHHPKPAWWANAGPLWVAHGCGSGCKVWAPMEAPNVGVEAPLTALQEHANGTD